MKDAEAAVPAIDSSDKKKITYIDDLIKRKNISIKTFFLQEAFYIYRRNTSAASKKRLNSYKCLPRSVRNKENALWDSYMFA